MSIAGEFLKAKKRSIFHIPEDMIADVFRPALDAVRNFSYRDLTLPGGRGSTKSSFISLVGVEGLMNNKQAHMLVLRSVKDTLKDSVYTQILWAIAKLGLSDEFECKVSPLEIRRKSTGQIIYFRGADDPTKIKSIKPPFGYIMIVWFEELDQFGSDKEIRSIVQSAVRGGDKAIIFKSFNPPKSSMNWANKDLKKHKAKRLIIKSTYLDVPSEWLGEAFIEEAEELKSENPAAYEHEYMGVANGTGGAVFDNVEDREITDNEIKIFDRIYLGQDWGWYPDPNRLIRMHYQANRKELYIFGELSGNKTPNDLWQQKIEESGIASKEELITADSSEEKSVKFFRDAGYLMRAAQKGPGSVEAGMKWLMSLKKIIIDPVRCPETFREFAEYEYLRNRDGDVISGYPDKNNHSIDAVRYATEQLWRKNE